MKEPKKHRDKGEIAFKLSAGEMGVFASCFTTPNLPWSGNQAVDIILRGVLREVYKRHCRGVLDGYFNGAAAFNLRLKEHEAAAVLLLLYNVEPPDPAVRSLLIQMTTEIDRFLK